VVAIVTFTFPDPGLSDAELRKLGRERMDAARAAAGLGLPYVPHSDTSIAAARSVTTVADTQRSRVLWAIKTYGPITDEEICARTGMNPSTERPRRGELVRANLVHDSGERGITNAGRKAVKWKTR
jgi:hypothetical protein